MLLIPAALLAKDKHPKNPTASQCVMIAVSHQPLVCVAEVEYFKEFHATLVNKTDLNLGNCAVKFIVKDKEGTVVNAPAAHTLSPMRSREKQWVSTSGYPADFEPVKDVQISCSGFRGAEWPVMLSAPIFPSAQARASYEEIQGNK